MKKTTIFDSVREATKAVLRFRDERGWGKYDTPMFTNSLTVEVGELLELFLWSSEASITQKAKSPKMKGQIADELADILYHILLLASHFDIDLPEAMESKMKKNAKKYPVEMGKKVSSYKDM